MKKIYFWSILILFILALLPAGLWAQNDTQRSASDSQHEPNTHVTATHAMDVGYAFMRTGSGSRSGGTQSGNVRKQAMQLVYTGRATDTLTRATTDCYYVFALQPKGFVIVAADNRVEPILGYSYDNNFVVENMPEHIRGWLNDYEKQIEVVTKSVRPAEADIQTKWTRLESGQPISNTRNDITVGPLLTTTWNQGQYYNTYCPADASGAGGHVYTGCVATAMAQIINYWQYPLHGRGTHGYNSYYGILEVNYDSTQYDFTNMPDALNSTSTLEQVNAVAQLMYHCGVAVNMAYTAEGSGALSVDVRAALVDQFRFSPQMGYAERLMYGYTEWIGMLQNEIVSGRPVFYGGVSDDIGHAFVCDGYDESNHFHFNFGWNGNGDGWYLISVINPGVYNFQSDQAAIIGIEPDSLSNTLYSLFGQMIGGFTQYSVDSVLFLCNELYDNPYNINNITSSEGTNENLLAFCPADTTQQLVLEDMLFDELIPSYHADFDRQYVNIYDGLPASYIMPNGQTNYMIPDSLLRHYGEDEDNTNHSPVVSTKHGLTLVIQNRFKAKHDFHFRISYDNGCHMVSNATWSVDTNTIHLSWHENGSATSWEVEYGLRGFNHGEGTMITANDTAIDITGLTSFRDYDIYIRSICGVDQKGPWCQVVSVMPEARYWTDVVTSQPEGYVEDSLGNVYISTAEGLAWFAKLSWGKVYDPDPRFFTGHKAVLTADINLSRYKWKPIYQFSGEFDGQGHSIDSMYAIERDWSGTALFASNESSVIKNIYLINCYSKQLEIQAASGLTIGSGTIMNCYVSGRIEGHGEVAAIANAGVLIINCVSNCTVLGRNRGTCGIALYGTKIRNCYSASIVKGLHPISYISGWGGSVENCYAYFARNGNLGITSGAAKSSSTWFNEADNGFFLFEPIFFEPDNQYYINLKDALNAGVRKYNLEGLRLWVDDTAGINEGMPIFGPEYVVTCPNIQNLAARNIVSLNSEYGVELSWNEMGDATTWEIECRTADLPDTMRIITNSSPDTLWGLAEQTTYIFRVRPICGVADYGGWSEEFSLVVDRPYWTEIVTMQPEGFSMDMNGNVTISTAEGLAWLASVVNGLNGQVANDFEGKIVTIVQDINIGQYKWTAINNFIGTFDGGGNTISGLYVNELKNNQGLFGIVYGGNYMNVVLSEANVKGIDQVGILIGKAEFSYTMRPGAAIINCHVSGIVSGDWYVGGMAGVVYGETINACSSSGTVSGNNTIGGLFGYVTLGRFDGANYYPYGSMRNCYSRCNIFSLRETTGYGVGGLIGSVATLLENCYATGDVIGAMVDCGGVVGVCNSSMHNCYGAVTMFPQTYGPFLIFINMGMLTGGGYNFSSPIISHCYGLRGSSYGDFDVPLIGPSNEGGIPIVSSTASFTVVENSIMLLDTVSVGQAYYYNLLDALNAWVDTYDTTGVYLHWVADTEGVNGGFPMFEEIRYNTVTLVAADSTPYGSFSGAGSHANYEPTIISAIPDYGYHFVEWNDGNTDNPRTIKLTQDTVFTAIFEKNMLSIVGTAGAGISYSFDFENPARDYLWTLQNGDYVDKWWITTLDDTSRALFISNSNGYGNRFTIQSNSIVSAYTTITLSSGQYSYSYDYHRGIGNNMTVALIPVIEQQTFDELTIFNLPDDAIRFGPSTMTNEWTHQSGQIYVPATGEYVFGVFWAEGYCCSGTLPASAIDNIQIYKISEEEDYHGYVLGSDTVPYLDTVVLTAVPLQEGWYFSHWQDGNTDNPRIVVADADKYYIAIFECTTSFSSDSVFGYDWYYWNDVAYTTSTEIIDTLVSYTGCDSIVTHYLTIYELMSKYVTLNVADSTPYGTVDGEGFHYGYFDITATISATPDYGYHFVSWNDGNTENPRYITLIQDTSFTAIFEKNTYYIVGTSEVGIDYDFDFEDSTLDRQWILWNRYYSNRWYVATVDDTNRALLISNNNGQSNTFNIESTSRVYAYTTLHLTSGQYNYNFDWRSNGGRNNLSWHYLRVILIPDSDEIDDNAWSDPFTLPSNAVRLHSQSYYLNSDFEWTNTNGTLSINEGGDYKMVFQWYNTYNYNCSNLSATVDNIHFYNNVPAEENNHGYVLGSDTVQYLDSVVLTAVPYEGYQFVQWHDGNTDNPRTVVADADKVLRAMFERAFIISDSIVACDSYQWHGNVYTASTMLFDTIPVAGGGDSIVAHYLLVNHPAHTAITETACESYVWTHADGTTQTCTVSDDYTYSHIDANGCTQVDTLHLTIYHGTHNVTTVTECESYTWTEGTGTTYTESGVYTYAYTNNNGCPSEDTLYLTINQSTTGEITISACDGFEWYDSTYTESGDYMLRLSNMAGCDSVVTLHLTVNHPAHTAITESACESYVWTHTDGTTQTYFVSGDYLYSHSDVNGCTQVDTLHLAIHHPSTSVDEQSACGPFTWINGETYTSSVFGPTYTLSNEAGCDSVVTLSLTMYHSDTTQFTVTACNSFVWGDSTYTETGDYAQTYEGSNGCLSVSIMHLTINYSDTTEESATACDSYLWHGNNYTESGDYTAYYTNTVGCYSMTTLHLTVNHSSVDEITATACENYEWHGIVYTESGDYDYTLTAANGCDSVITLHLTVNENVATEFTITTADSCYIWNGQSYCASGDYTQSFETVNGCDSVVTLHLTITVGIDDYDFANVMKLYPNPTSDLVNVQLTINNEQLGEVGIQVFDVYGRLLEVINMADARGASLQTTQIDLSRYANGVYFIKAVSEGKVLAVRKVVKK